MFESIDKLLKRNQLVNPSLLLSPEVCFLAKNAILELIPESKEKINIISYKDSRLKISSQNPILLHKIKMCEEEIIKKVQRKIKIKTFRIIYLPGDNFS